jgi:prepilin-type N-terminal cleavage/methylation domain-containing protein
VKKMMTGMRRARRGFSLLEVLFTVLILAVLAAVAVPLYSNTKATAAASACKSNIQAIANAESRWKFEQGSYSIATASTDLINYGIAVWPTCPSGAGAYTVAVSGTGVKISCATHTPANDVVLP